MPKRGGLAIAATLEDPESLVSRQGCELSVNRLRVQGS